MKTGDIVHIKDSFFELVKSDTNKVMNNHEDGGQRPHHICIQDKNNHAIFWAVPISSKVPKYKRLIEEKESKYGKCDTLFIAEFYGKESAFLIQNVILVTEEYLDHPHTISNQATKANEFIQKNIESRLNNCINLYKNGRNPFFTDIELMLNRLMQLFK